MKSICLLYRVHCPGASADCVSLLWERENCEFSRLSPVLLLAGTCTTESRQELSAQGQSPLGGLIRFPSLFKGAHSLIRRFWKVSLGVFLVSPVSVGAAAAASLEGTGD